MPSYSSPNRLVRQYFEALCRAVVRARQARDNQQKQEIVVAVFLGIAVVEVFLNVFFRVVVEEGRYKSHKTRFLKDLSRPFLSLDRKWKEWPLRILSNSVDREVFDRFCRLKDLRNSLMHFTSSHDTVELPGNMRVEGLPNTSHYDDLTTADAEEAIQVAEDAIAGVLRAKGVPGESIPRILQLWTGKVPL